MCYERGMENQTHKFVDLISGCHHVVFGWFIAFIHLPAEGW